ncbi:hypothetical protein C0992_008080 [Termitomyces sp. T32_za158]|nr:hypothetical protein C0992_008080 [Termitomyces sp. T32_za158]
MYSSSELDSLLNSDCSSSTSPSPCSYPFTQISLKDQQARLDLNKQATSYAILAASSDLVLAAGSISDLWDVNGSVKLALCDAQDIRSVVVSVLGQIVTRVNATRHITFLNITKTLWSRERDLNPYSLWDPVSRNRRQKLSGDHYWPFSISLPKKVLLFNRRKHETGIFRLPESFNERDVRASVQYSIHLRLTRGKFKADDRLRITLVCPPAELSPLLRQKSCDTLFLMRGPQEDPGAWYTHKGVVSGRFEGHHLNNVRYTVSNLSLAKPLMYARGSVIPFSLEIEADNEDLLNIFSAPEVPVLRLRRSVTYDDGIPARFQPFPKREAIEYSNLAVWWPSSESRSPNTRRLSGELQLPPDMKATTTIADFRIKELAVYELYTANDGYDHEDRCASNEKFNVKPKSMYCVSVHRRTSVPSWQMIAKFQK